MGFTYSGPGMDKSSRNKECRRNTRRSSVKKPSRVRWEKRTRKQNAMEANESSRAGLKGELGPLKGTEDKGTQRELWHMTKQSVIAALSLLFVVLVLVSMGATALLKGGACAPCRCPVGKVSAEVERDGGKREEISSLRYLPGERLEEPYLTHPSSLTMHTVPRMQPTLFQNHERFHYLQYTLGWISTGPSQSKNLRELRNSSSFLRANITGRIPPIKVHKFGVRAYLLGRHHPFVTQLCPIRSHGELDGSWMRTHLYISSPTFLSYSMCSFHPMPHNLKH